MQTQMSGSIVSGERFWAGCRWNQQESYFGPPNASYPDGPKADLATVRPISLCDSILEDTVRPKGNEGNAIE